MPSSWWILYQSPSRRSLQLLRGSPLTSIVPIYGALTIAKTCPKRRETMYDPSWKSNGRQFGDQLGANPAPSSVFLPPVSSQISNPLTNLRPTGHCVNGITNGRQWAFSSITNFRSFRFLQFFFCPHFLRESPGPSPILKLFFSLPLPLNSSTSQPQTSSSSTTALILLHDPSQEPYQVA